MKNWREITFMILKSMKTKNFYLTKKPLRAIIALLISSIFIVATIGCSYNDYYYQEYANFTQIEEIADSLGFDLEDATTFKDYKVGQFIHNGNSPIQIVIKPELKKYLLQIESALDIIFDVLHSINDKYSYRIVENPNEGMPTITFETRSLGNGAAGMADKFVIPGRATDLKDKILLYKASVVIDPYEFEQLKEFVKPYILAHELAHVFSILKDQYNDGWAKSTDKHKANTFIKIEIGAKVNMLTPYDFSGAISIYTPQAKNDADLKAKIKAGKELLEEYSKRYYDYYTSCIKDLFLKEMGIFTPTTNDFTYSEDFTFSFRIYNSLDYVNTCYYQLTCQKGEYNLKIYDKNNMLLDESLGKVIISNGVLVLKDVEFQKGFKPNEIFGGTINGYVQDLAVCKTDNGVYLFDCYDLSIINGTVTFH